MYTQEQEATDYPNTLPEDESKTLEVLTGRSTRNTSPAAGNAAAECGDWIDKSFLSV